MCIRDSTGTTTDVPAATALAGVRGGFDFARISAVEGGPVLHGAVAPADVAEIQTLSAGDEIVNAHCARSCFLVTSDTYYPGWSATIDDQPARIYRADYALRGVYLNAGSHVIVFRYQPIAQWIGVAVSLLSALTLIACVGRRRAFVSPPTT